MIIRIFLLLCMMGSLAITLNAAAGGKANLAASAPDPDEDEDLDEELDDDSDPFEGEVAPAPKSAPVNPATQNVPTTNSPTPLNAGVSPQFARGGYSPSPAMGDPYGVPPAGPTMGTPIESMPPENFGPPRASNAYSPSSGMDNMSAPMPRGGGMDPLPPVDSNFDPNYGAPNSYGPPASPATPSNPSYGPAGYEQAPSSSYGPPASTSTPTTNSYGPNDYGIPPSPGYGPNSPPDYGPDYSNPASSYNSLGNASAGNVPYGAPKSSMDQGNFSWRNLDLHSLVTPGATPRG